MSLIRTAYYGGDGQLTIQVMDALLRCEPDGPLEPMPPRESFLK